MMKMPETLATSGFQHYFHIEILEDDEYVS
jgi:hypothetical protein